MDGNLLFLNTFIHKTIKDNFEIPVPDIVRTTVEMLEEMSEETRIKTGEPWLFRTMKGSFGKSGFVTKRLDQNLNAFVAFNKLSPPMGSDRWTLASHQFRRGFAVFFYHGFEWATIEGLSLFLGHYDPDMTQIYVNEILTGEIGRLRDELDGRLRADRSAMTADDLQEKRELCIRLEEIVSDFKDAKLEAYLLKCLKVHRGEEKPIGLGVPRLFENVRRARESAHAFVRVASRSNSPEHFEESFIDEIKRQAFHRGLEPTPDRSALCHADNIGNTDLATRECAKLAQAEPIFQDIGYSKRSPDDIIRAFSSANICLKCIHGCFFRQNVMTVENKMRRIEQSRTFASSPEAAQDAHQLFLEYEANMMEAQIAAGETL